MKTISILALTLFAALALSACGSDDSGDGAGANDSNTNGTDVITDGAGATDGSTDGTDVITTCTELCAFAPVDASTADCVVDIILTKGNTGVLTEPICAASNTSATNCLACYTATSVSDADCTSAHSGCF